MKVSVASRGRDVKMDDILEQRLYMRTSALYKEKLRKKITLLWKVSTAHNVSLVRIMITVWMCCIWKIKIHSSWEKQSCLNWYRCSSRPLTPDLRLSVSLVGIFLLQCFVFFAKLSTKVIFYTEHNYFYILLTGKYFSDPALFSVTWAR